jgi:subtilisin-like proprotein convertase family protein
MCPDCVERRPPWRWVHKLKEMNIYRPIAFPDPILIMDRIPPSFLVGQQVTHTPASWRAVVGSPTLLVTFILALCGLTPAFGQTASFSNPSAITIPDSGAGTPYPSTISVSGTAGTISQVVVRLNGCSHTYPDDLDMLLVGPTGQKVVVMSDAGGGGDINNVTLTFSDGASAALSDSGQLVSGTFKPTNIGTTDTFPAPAPGGPYATTLSVFNGLSANGVWSLFLVDDAAVDRGSISGGWTLTITTVGGAPAAPTIGDIPDQATTINTTTAAIPFSVNDADTPATSLTLSGSSSNPTLVPDGTIVFGGSGTSRTVTVTPAANQTGTTTITVTVSDGALTASDTFVLTVNAANTAPTISDIADLATDEDSSTGALSFTVDDGETAAGSLTVNGSSSNPALVPDANIEFGGSGANRTVTVNPAPNQSGTATITVTVSDGELSANDSFVLTVNAVNDPPTISNISDQSTTAGTAVGPIGFTVGDVETAAGSLILSGSSSNPTLVPDGNIVFGGNGSSRTVTVTPAANETGTTTISVIVTDGTLTAADTFVVSVSSSSSGTASFSNVSAITIPGQGVGTPYPSTINVSGTAGTISQVVLNLNGFTHTYPDDLDVLLVSPTGQIVVVMSDAGGGSDVNNVSLTLSDGAAVALPDSGQIVSGTFKPSDFGTGDAFPTPAPAGPYGATLSAFNGVSANGVWSLFVVDDAAVDQGSFSGGWTLTITTVGSAPAAPTISDVADQSTTMNAATAAIPFTVNDADTPAASLVLSGSSSNPTLVPNGNIVFGGSGSSSTVTVTPAANQTGTTTITVTVGDGALTASDTFVLTVNAVNTAPSISDIADRTTDEDTSSGALSFTVGDGETAAGSLTLSGSSSNPALVPNGNIGFGGSGANRTVTISPAPNQSGTATITVTVSDGQLSASDGFLLTVNAVNDPPTISNIANQSTSAGTAVGPISFTVGDVETAAGSLVLNGSSSNPTLVPDGNIAFGGSGTSRTVTVTPAANQTGTATITVTVSDGALSVGDTFVLTVNAGNTAPTISDIANQTINEDASTGALSFTVGDGETAAGSLTLSGSSSNPTLVPNGNIGFGGSGANRTVTVSPASNQDGTATITVTVSDGQLSAGDSFVLTVNAVNDPPTISNIANQSTTVGTAVGPISFTIGDVETAAGSLVLSGSSSNPTLVPNGNIALGGSGSSRSVTVTPAANQSGSATITVTVNDGVNNASDTFVLTVNPPQNLPDLIVWGPSVSPRIATVTFSSSSCAVVEGLVQAGTRKLLRFSTETRNQGTADIYLGNPASNPLFVYAPCHGHYHFNNYANYRLLDSNGQSAASGLKIGFCLLDSIRWSSSAPSSARYTCSNQGIQRGWGDLYDSTLDGQWIDITGVPDGTYTLELEVNPLQILPESDYGNNITRVAVTIGSATPPPPNNNFANAQGLSGGSASVIGTTINATKESGEPNHAGNSGGHSVWYFWTAPGNTTVVVDTVGSSFDTLLAVYRGNSVNALTTVASNDDIASGNLQSRVTFTPVAGTTYRIAVDGYGGASGGIVLTLSQIPSNDNFAFCEFTGGASGLVTGSTREATKETAEPNHAGNSGGHSIWYCWTAPDSGSVTFDTIGSNFDTLLAVYTGDTVNGLTVRASNDNISGNNLQSRVTFSVVGTTMYHIAIDGRSGAVGNTTLSWSLTAGAGPQLAGLHDIIGSDDSANADLESYRPALNYNRLAAGEYELVITGKPFHSYSIVVSSDLVDWAPLTTTLADSTGAAYFRDKTTVHTHHEVTDLIGGTEPWCAVVPPAGTRPNVKGFAGPHGVTESGESRFYRVVEAP